MSAIAVVRIHSPGAEPHSLLRAMLSNLEMYGPDREAAEDLPQVSLGGSFRNLLPEDRFSVQPLWSADRSCCLVADVRLDNRAELSRALDITGAERLADSAFLLLAFVRWGRSCVDHLVGGFAFVVWTPSSQELFAARDHTGERPLFYHRCLNYVAFSSMAKGLLALPGVVRDTDESHYVHWLAGLQQPDRGTTFFQAIRSVPPGHCVVAGPDSFRCTEYWHPARTRSIRFQKDSDYAERLVELLDQATCARLRSTDPIGAFLSAGLDSSSVAASAARLLEQDHKELTVFTAVPRPEFNHTVNPWHLPSEGPGAAETAALYPNMEHVTVNSSGQDLPETMQKWTYAWDEPIPGLTNSLWITAILHEARRRGIRVMLEGGSGNGTISYNTFSILRQWLLRGRWWTLAAAIRRLRQQNAIALKGAVRASTSGLLPHSLMRLAARPESGLFVHLLNPELERKYHLHDKIFDSIYCKPLDLIREHSQLFQYADPGAVHTAIQAISGVEMRDPTADKRIVEFCFSIPHEQYLLGGRTRSLIRRAMVDRLPSSTLNSRRRGSQGADWYVTMTEALPAIRSEVRRIKESPAACSALDVPAMEALLDNWPAVHFHKNSVALRWHFALSSALSLGNFLRTQEVSAPPLDSSSVHS